MAAVMFLLRSWIVSLVPYDLMGVRRICVAWPPVQAIVACRHPGRTWLDVDCVAGPHAAQTWGRIHRIAIERAENRFYVSAPHIAGEGHVSTLRIGTAVDHVAVAREVIVGNSNVTITSFALQGQRICVAIAYDAIMVEYHIAQPAIVFQDPVSMVGGAR